MFPRQELQVVERVTLFVKDQLHLQAIREIRVFGVVESGRLLVGVTDALNIPRCMQTLRGNNIQCNVQSCFSNDRIDLVGDKCLACEPHADIAAKMKRGSDHAGDHDLRRYEVTNIVLKGVINRKGADSNDSKKKEK